MRDKAFFKGTLQEACTFVERVAKQNEWSWDVKKSNGNMAEVCLSHRIDLARFPFNSHDVLRITLQENNRITVFDMSAADEYWTGEEKKRNIDWTTPDASVMMMRQIFGTRWYGLQVIWDTLIKEMAQEERRTESAQAKASSAVSTTSEPTSNQAPSATQARLPGELEYVEQKILEVYQDLQRQGLHTSDGEIAARLPQSRKGQPYSRETVNRKRQAMRRRGIVV